jgi:transglutaminase-like putative cysteine protease
MTTRLDSRNVAWMALSMALVTLPHVERLPIWITALAALAISGRLYIGRKGGQLPRKWLLLIVVAGASAGIYFSFGTLFGRDAGVALLVIMLTLKLLEMASMRDAMIVIFLSYFVVLTNFLYSQTIPTALLMLVGVWVITGTMIGLQWREGALHYQETLRLSAVMLAQATPVMLVLFVLFPRVQGPIWGLPRDAFAGITGLSDSMSPGTLSRLSLSDAVAFRVQFRGQMPKPNQLYWRGPVLWYFDGMSWHMGMTFETAPASYAPVGSGGAYSYTVTLEPHDKRWLFALDLPAKLAPESRFTTDFQMLSNRPVRSRIRYEMTSHTSYRLGYEGLSPYERRRALQLPEGYNWRSRALALNMRNAARDEEDMVNQVLAMFRTQPFFYTLTPPLLGDQPVDDFLFNTRSGFCEHYASAFAFLMRAAGIPTRVVTGYQGGEINPIGDYMIVRQSEAHAWAEVWIEGRGWVRVDPTAAVSPLRVESGIAAAVPATDGLPLALRSNSEWLRQLRFTWDSFANTWNQWVLGYNPERQYWLLSRVGLDRATWQTLAMILFGITALITCIFAALILRRLRSRTRDPVAAIYARFCRKLARRGAQRAPSEGPADFAVRAASRVPEAAGAIHAITEVYIDLRYGARGAEADMRRMKKMVRQLEL